MPLWLLTGGARSGKSRLALRLAAESGLAVTYLATAEPLDDEMTTRIVRHQEERPDAWRTIEEPRDLPGAVEAAAAGCLLIDCLTVWTSNRLLESLDDTTARPAAIAMAEHTILGDLERALTLIDARPTPTIVVTNEVGDGVVPNSPLVRAYRDILGIVNQRVAAQADRLYLCTAGYALDLKAAGAQPVAEIQIDGA